MQGNPIQIQTPMYWNLISNNVTTHACVTPSSIILPPLSPDAVIRTKKNFTAF
jgi:hypothetical protein